MTKKPLQVLSVLGATAIALLFAKLMFDMSRSMSEMTVYVENMSRSVAILSHAVGDMSLVFKALRVSMRTMNDSILRMDRSISSLGQPFSQGTEQLQQWNPAGMMRQMIPGSGESTR